MKKQTLLITLAIVACLLLTACIPIVLYTYVPPSWSYGTWTSISGNNPYTFTFSSTDISDSSNGSWTASSNITFDNQYYTTTGSMEEYTVNFYYNGVSNYFRFRHYINSRYMTLYSTQGTFTYIR